MLLDKTLKELEDSIRIARQSRIDLSQEYDPKKRELGYEIQSKIRLDTREIIAYYIDWTGRGGDFHTSIDDSNPYNEFGISYPRLPENVLQKALELLNDSIILFGKNLFHHIIEGRLAFIVKREVDSGNPVPSKYKEAYQYFQFNPWNDPFANYSSPRDCIRSGDLTHMSIIPPEFSDNN